MPGKFDFQHGIIYYHCQIGDEKGTKESRGRMLEAQDIQAQKEDRKE